MGVRPTGLGWAHGHDTDMDMDMGMDIEGCDACLCDTSGGRGGGVGCGENRALAPTWRALIHRACAVIEVCSEQLIRSYTRT